MYYHAKIEYEGKSHHWWNRSKDGLIKDLLIPYVNGQVVLVNRNGHKSLLNMRSVSFITVYKTNERLHKPAGKGHPLELDTDEFMENACTAEIMGEIQIEHATTSSRSILQKALAPPEPQVFVVMKFGDSELDSAYEGVIKPAIEQYGLKAIRIDEIQDSGSITDQILEHIASSKYVFVDLTGERPNCYYECGFAHALGKELILTIKDSETIHFDLAGYRFITWSTEAELRRKLRQRFNNLESSAHSET